MARLRRASGFRTTVACRLRRSSSSAARSRPPAFGYDRSRAISRLADHFRLYDELWENRGLVDFDGKTVDYRQASLGSVRGHKPRALGDGARGLVCSASPPVTQIEVCRILKQRRA